MPRELYEVVAALMVEYDRSYMDSLFGRTVEITTGLQRGAFFYRHKKSLSE
jgi:hypothetical protein